MLLATASSGCLFHKRTTPAATVTVPPPPQPRTVPQPQLPSPPPSIPPAQPQQPPVTGQTDTQLPPPPELPRRTPKRARQAQRPAANPAPDPTGSAPQPPPEQPAAPRRVGPLLSTADQQKYTQAVDSAIRNAEQNLAGVDGMRAVLTQRQQTMAAQARNFLQQAKELRASDLVAARSMADRAAQISRDLLASLR